MGHVVKCAQGAHGAPREGACEAPRRCDQVQFGVACHDHNVNRISLLPRASKRREAVEAAAPYRKTHHHKPSMHDEDVPRDPRSSDFSVDKWGQPANWPRYWRPKVVRGIPEWALAKNYIQYRKCKYIEDIRYATAYNLDFTSYSSIVLVHSGWIILIQL